MSIREKRLSNDFLQLSEFIANSGGMLRLISSQGNPPYEYVIEYHCRGIEKLQRNEPIMRHTHRVEITLGNNYPREKPSAKFLTPIYHPNVFENLNVCLGNKWTITETLTELVLRIGKIIQYTEDITNLNSPANSQAKSWALNNQWRFPLDHQTFKSQTADFQIAWQEM